MPFPVVSVLAYLIDLQKAIREYLAELIGNNAQHIATREQLVTFGAAWDVDAGDSCGPCCSADNFKIDLLGSPHSSWNRSAARVFTDAFIQYQQLPRTSAVIQDVIDRFHNRIKSLKAKNKRALQPRLEQENISRSTRQFQRKRTVRFAILTVCTPADPITRSCLSGVWKRRNHTLIYKDMSQCSNGLV